MNVRSRLFPIYFTVFLDMLGVGIVIPVLAPLILSPDSLLVIVGLNGGTRAVILGLLIAAYPLAQFFGAPIIGALSDTHGRKPILLLSLAGTLVGYLFFASGILWHNIWLLFTSRLIDGFTGGNISVAMSAIADVSSREDKAKNFGLVGMMFGLGFILGPYIGGKLSDPHLASWFNFATPFFFAALLSACNMLLLQFNFQETLLNRIRAKISALTGVRHLLRAVKMEKLRVMFLVMFLLIFGFNFFTQFFQVYLLQKFSFTQSQIGDFFAYVGLWIALTQGFLIRPIAKRFTPLAIVRVTILLLSVALLALLLPTHAWQLLLVMPFIAIANGLTHPNATAIISNLTDPTAQGEVFGITQSFQSLGMALPPLIAGLIVTVHQSLPITVASITVFVAWVVLVTCVKKNA